MEISIPYNLKGIIVATDKKAYRREYMRWYMAQKRRAASKPTSRHVLSPDLVGPPCPANLPDRPTDGRHYVGQIELLKAQLAHALLLWRDSSEDLAMQVDMLTMENEALKAQAENSMVEKPNLPAPTAPPKLPQAKTLPAPPKPEAPKPDLDQYLLDKAKGFVDPDRKPLDSHDEINF
jgi:hypothetical protein